MSNSNGSAGRTFSFFDGKIARGPEIPDNYKHYLTFAYFFILIIKNVLNLTINSEGISPIWKILILDCRFKRISFPDNITAGRHFDIPALNGRQKNFKVSLN
jgi:hypothetical protein